MCTATISTLRIRTSRLERCGRSRTPSLPRCSHSTRSHSSKPQQSSEHSLTATTDFDKFLEQVSPRTSDERYVYRAAGVLHGTEPGPLQALPLTETSEVRRNRHVYPAASVKALQNVFERSCLDLAFHFTAIVVEGDQFEVIGKSYVVIYDNQRQIRPNGSFYFLAAGDRYNLKTREATRPTQRMEPIDRVKRVSPQK
jgi:hypothetical protein